MVLWQLPAAKLFVALEDLVNTGVPSDPWEELLFREFLKHRPGFQEMQDADRMSYGAAVQAQQSFLALLTELRLLERKTPLRYREFVRLFDAGNPRKTGSAIQFMKDQAGGGDEDAVCGLLRATVECQEDRFAELSQALFAIQPQKTTVEDFLVLYRDSPHYAPRLNLLRQALEPVFEEMAAVSQRNKPRLVVPPAPPRAPSPAPRPQSKVASMVGPGYLAVLNADGQLEALKVEAESVHQWPVGYRFFTYERPFGSYTGGGVTRRIQLAQLSDCLGLLALHCDDGTIDLVCRVSGQHLARLPEGFTAFTRASDDTVLVGGQAGLHSLSGSTLEPRSAQAVWALSGDVMVLQDGVMSVAGEPLFELDQSRKLRLSADGKLLAQWNEQGDVEIYEIASGRSLSYFPTKTTDLDLSFSLDSARLLTASVTGLMLWSLQGAPLVDLCPPKVVGMVPPPPVETDIDLDNLSRLAHHDGFYDRLSQ